ncbi:MAG: DUF3021 domain-containing protein [Anaeroplasmataceae bacterium]|nr:DUF3021 domain-containing protein [Anaeroplasmataceae bacterium]
MKKNIILRSLIGAPIGVVISLLITIIISICIGNGQYYAVPRELINLCGSEIVAVIVQLSCSLIVGAIGGASSIIWGIESWSLSKQTLVHMAVLVIPYFPISYLLNWMPHHLYGALAYIGAFVVAYVGIWGSIYISIKSKIKKMNKYIQELE